MRIIGFDPGRVTGVVVLEVTDTIQLVETHQLAGFDLLELLSENRADSFDEVVYESFILRRGSAYTSDQTIPCYVIGSLEYWSYSTEGKMPIGISPAQNKSGVSDADIAKLGLGPEGHAQRHQRDAIRVVLNYLIERRNMVVLRGLR